MQIKILQTVHHPVSARAFIAPVVKCLRDRGYETGFWVQPHAGAERFLENLEVPYEAVSTDLHFNPLIDAERVLNIRRRIRAVRPAVVHCHQSRAALLPLLAAMLEGVPIRVYHNHGLGYAAYSGVMSLLLRLLERINIQLATHVLFVSRSTFERAREDGLLLGKRAGLAGPGSIAGIDLAQYSLERTSATAQAEARRALKLPMDAYVVGYVGRPVKRKGFLELLDSWRESKLYEQDAILMLAGCNASDVTKVAGGGVAGVCALGYQQDMTRFYAACDVLALPSWAEGFPYAVLEASASARPTVGTQVLGIRDAIEHGRTGLVIQPHDTRALAEALVRLRREPELRLRMGRAAREMIENSYSRDKVLGALAEYYEQDLLGGMAGREQAARPPLVTAPV